jgi:hypothetical protein
MEEALRSAGAVVESLRLSFGDEPRPLELKLSEEQRALLDARYRQLCARKEDDGAWCVAQALVVADVATAEQQRTYALGRGTGLIAAQRPLDEAALWRHVLHPDQDRRLGSLLGVLAPALAGWRARDGEEAFEAGLEPEPESSSTTGLVRHVARALDLEQPALARSSAARAPIELWNLRHETSLQPTIVFGPALATIDDEAELGFGLGAHMLGLYPPHFASVALERVVANHKVVLMAVMRLCGAPLEAHDGIDEIAHELRVRMTSTTLDAVCSLMRRFVVAGSSIDITRWVGAMQRSQLRAGLLIGGDLRAALNFIAREPAREHSLSRTLEVEELLRYSVSDDYFAARRMLGVGVGSSGSSNTATFRPFKPA